MSNPFFGGRGGHNEVECPPLVHMNQLEKPSPLRIIKKKSRLEPALSRSTAERVPLQSMPNVAKSSTAEGPVSGKHIPMNLQPWLTSIRTAGPSQAQYCDQTATARNYYRDYHIQKASETRHSSSASSNSYGAASFPDSSGFLHPRTRDTSLEFEEAKSIEASCPIERHGLEDDMDFAFQGILPQVLVPRVNITTDTGGLLHDDTSCVWAAVEISGKLSHTYSADTTHTGITSSDKPTGGATDDQLDCFFKHGRLYDLSVEVLSSSDTEIAQVLHQHSFPTVIYSGSTILLLVQIRFCRRPQNSLRFAGQAKTRSDQLIEDLESQLGHCSVPYMQLRITYSHSAFPEYSGSSRPNGISYLSSRLETTATASLKRFHQSNWCTPILENTNALFEVMKRHWDLEKCSRIFGQIKRDKPVTPRPISQSTRRASCSISDAHSSSTSNSPSQLFPVRRSLKEVIQLPKAMASESERRTVSQTTGSTEPGFRKIIKRRSLGSEFLQGLAPDFGGLRVEGDNGYTRKDVSAPIFEHNSKDTWMWNWGSWF